MFKVEMFFRVTNILHKKKAVLKFTFLFAPPKNPTQTRITASAISLRVKFGGRESERDDYLPQCITAVYIYTM